MLTFRITTDDSQPEESRVAGQTDRLRPGDQALGHSAQQAVSGFLLPVRHGRGPGRSAEVEAVKKMSAKVNVKDYRRGGTVS